MKKLITLRGNSGSGKTTIARALQEKFGKNTMLLSQDVIRRDILKTNDGAGTRANDVLIMLLEYGHAHNELVILEGILNSRWYTPLFDAAKALYGENICAYYFDLPFEETLRRHQTKDKRTEFGEKEMRRWWNEKDYAPALNEQTLTPDMMQDEIIDRIGTKERWVNRPAADPSELAIASIREGTVPGIHTVTYTSADDVLTLRHEILNRRTLALGAVIAAEFLNGKRGDYTMNDLLK